MRLVTYYPFPFSFHKFSRVKFVDGNCSSITYKVPDYPDVGYRSSHWFWEPDAVCSTHTIRTNKGVLTAIISYCKYFCFGKISATIAPWLYSRWEGLVFSVGSYPTKACSIHALCIQRSLQVGPYKTNTPHLKQTRRSLGKMRGRNSGLIRGVVGWTKRLATVLVAIDHLNQNWGKGNRLYKDFG